MTIIGTSTLFYKGSGSDRGWRVLDKSERITAHFGPGPAEKDRAWLTAIIQQNSALGTQIEQFIERYPETKSRALKAAQIYLSNGVYQPRPRMARFFNEVAQVQSQKDPDKLYSLQGDARKPSCQCDDYHKFGKAPMVHLQHGYVKICKHIIAYNLAIYFNRFVEDQHVSATA